MNHDKTANAQRPLLVVMLGLLVAMGVVILLVVMTSEVQPSHGFAHPEFPETMQQGGSGLKRHAAVRWLGLTLGLLQIAFFVGCLLLGLQKLAGRAGLYIWVGLVHGIVFALMVICDHFYAQGKLTNIVGGFPVPTALMIYGVGGVPVAFTLLYLWRFDQWVLTPEEFARFERLVEDKRRAEEMNP